jgi:ketosteroid isomerase-like protein
MRRMTSTIESQIRDEIWQILQDINDAWVNDRTDELNRFFHENMVIASPDFRKLGEGRDACVKSYKDFRSQAIIHDLHEEDAAIDVFGDTAIATYRFEITYEMNGKTFSESGRDVFIFVREEEGWQAVWRTVVPMT